MTDTHSLTALALRATHRGEHELATRCYEYVALQRVSGVHIAPWLAPIHPGHMGAGLTPTGDAPSPDFPHSGPGSTSSGLGAADFPEAA